MISTGLTASPALTRYRGDDRDDPEQRDRGVRRRGVGLAPPFGCLLDLIAIVPAKRLQDWIDQSSFGFRLNGITVYRKADEDFQPQYPVNDGQSSWGRDTQSKI